MRITGGQARGRNIGGPSAGAVRPTSSKVRQALFNILGKRIENAKFLDICAGSGLVGLEALSRGASALTSVEEDKAIAKRLAAAAEKLGYNPKILPLDFKKALRLLKGEKFDLIFADPPYRGGFTPSILAAICEYELLADDGLIIVEHLNNTTIDAKTNLIKTSTRAYGQTALSFFAHHP
jgi:16S rRNA (guanine966-N2)-methyltransferase